MTGRMFYLTKFPWEQKKQNQSTIWYSPYFPNIPFLGVNLLCRLKHREMFELKVGPALLTASALISEGCWLWAILNSEYQLVVSAQLGAFYSSISLPKASFCFATLFISAFLCPLIRTLILFSLITVWWLIVIKQKRQFIFSLRTVGPLLHGMCVPVLVHFLPAACKWCAAMHGMCVYLWTFAISLQIFMRTECQNYKMWATAIK